MVVATQPMIYVDTSALVPVFVGEARSAAIAQWLAGQQPGGLCSAIWCVSEMASALSLKTRQRLIQPDVADDAWQSFIEACDDGLLTLLAVEQDDFQLAAHLCRDAGSGLRAADALHLAVAMRTQSKSMQSFDSVLNRNAAAHGLNLIDL